MKFYKYWAPADVQFPGNVNKLRAYGGSDNSLEEAQQRAREIAERMVAAIERGKHPDAYSYGRQLREEIVEQIRGNDGLVAVVTRNSYGSLVLNTQRAMFVDVDYETGRLDLAAGVKKLWKQLTGERSRPTERDDALLARFEQITQQRSGLGVRVYRTAGGFRLLVTSDTYDPTSAESEKLLTSFGSDPLYARLCKSQECFRARLSAKHWRCGAPRPPMRFPWADAAEEARYRQWEQAYHREANQYATCAPVGNFGSPTVHAAVQPILETHDRLTIKDGAPLA